jgi:hypothetical protein
MKGLGVTAVFGFVSFLLSYGLFVPSDLRPFNIISAAAAMAGYALGSQATKVVNWLRGTLMAVSALACLCFVVSYVIYVQRGSGEMSDVIWLAVLLFGIFFSFTFLMPLAGAVIEKKSFAG